MDEFPEFFLEVRIITRRVDVSRSCKKETMPSYASRDSEFLAETRGTGLPRWASATLAAAVLFLDLPGQSFLDLPDGSFGECAT